MYHLSVKVVQRSKGRSAVAASAYRAREKLLDVRQGMTFDYSAKQDLIHKEIVGFSGSREELWNVAELAEKRKDATTAKEYEVTIPRELSPEMQIKLIQEFAKYLNEKYEVAVDFAIHNDLENNNPHAHILTTTRAVENENQLSKLKVARDWSDAKRKKNGMKGRKTELVEVRKEWAEIANKYLKMENHEKQIDHRSLKDQGIDLIPGIHVGPNVSAMTKKGIETDRQNIANEIKELNSEIVISSELAEEIENQRSNKFDDFRPVPTFENPTKKKAVVEVQKTPSKYEPELSDISENEYYLDVSDPYSEASEWAEYYPFKSREDEKIQQQNEQIKQAELIIQAVEKKAFEVINNHNQQAIAENKKQNQIIQNNHINKSLWNKFLHVINKLKPVETAKPNLMSKADYDNMRMKPERDKLENLKAEREATLENKTHNQNMKLTSNNYTPEIEPEHNDIIDIEPQNITASQDNLNFENVLAAESLSREESEKITAVETQKINKIGEDFERVLQEIEDELTQEPEFKPDDNSPSF